MEWSSQFPKISDGRLSPFLKTLSRGKSCRQNWITRKWFAPSSARSAPDTTRRKPRKLVDPQNPSLLLNEALTDSSALQSFKKAGGSSKPFVIIEWSLDRKFKKTDWTSKPFVIIEWSLEINDEATIKIVQENLLSFLIEFLLTMLPSRKCFGFHE